MDVIAYADIYTAFSENRPYRLGMKADEILNILSKDFKVKHGTKSFTGNRTEFGTD